MDDLEDLCEREELEEIESRLYSEIYHSKIVDDKDNCTNLIPAQTERSNLRSYFRYFESSDSIANVSNKASSFVISVEPEPGSSGGFPLIQNNITVIPPAYLNNSGHFPSNITVNQYICPSKEIPLFTNGELSSFWIDENRQFLSNEVNKLTRKQRRQLDRYRRKNQNPTIEDLEFMLAGRIKDPEQPVSICLSDDSDDCIIFDDVKSKRKNNKRQSNLAPLEPGHEVENKKDDDDVIYIPPAPAEIISVDEDDENEDSSKKEENSPAKSSCLDKDTQDLNKNLQEPESSNDFLDSSNLGRSSENFNFGLHGRDFTNSQSELACSSKPVDYCETESSCSTNEHNRDFNNSVKTVVFDEIEFPKGDIFSENNLDTFSSLITPKRHLSDKVPDTPKSSEVDSKKKACSDSNSSCSSSESDYESVTPIIKKTKSLKHDSLLPNLSPLVPDPEETAKRPKRKCTVNSNNAANVILKSSKKRKSDVGDNNKKPGKKKKNSKKKNVSLENMKDPYLFSECAPDSQALCADVEKSSKKKKKKSSESEPQFTSVEQTTKVVPSSTETDVSLPKKKKKKKRTKNNAFDESISGAGITAHIIEATLETEDPESNQEVEFISEYERDSINERTLNKNQSLSNCSSEIVTESEKCCAKTSNVVEVHEGTVIIIDEVEDSDVEIIVSSDSSEPIILDDIESDLSLANCQKDPVNSPKRLELEDIQRTQSDNPEKWQILDSDRLLFSIPGKIGPRCTRCRHFGHVAVNCPDKPCPPPCTLCGEPDHQEPRCPNKVCRQCGNSGDYSTSYCWSCFKFRHSRCRLCHMNGHIARNCPDLWRRYHLTTVPGPLEIPAWPLLKPRNEQWCCGCARSGHLEHECENYPREYPPTTPNVMNYNDVFDSHKSSNSYDVPCEDLSLHVGQMSDQIAVSQEPQSLLALEIPNSDFTVPDDNRIVYSSVSNSNLKVEISNNVPNPFWDPNNTRNSPKQVGQMQPNFSNSDINKRGEKFLKKYSSKKITNIIMNNPSSVVKEFLRQELEELETKVKHYSPKFLRSKFFKSENISHSTKPLPKRILRQKDFWFRVFNMYIFGIHQYRDGKLHIHYLRRYLNDSNELNTSKRRSLLSSYTYIFGIEKHINVSYNRILKMLIKNHDDNSIMDKSLL